MQEPFGSRSEGKLDGCPARLVSHVETCQPLFPLLPSPRFFSAQILTLIPLFVQTTKIEETAQNQRDFAWRPSELTDSSGKCS